MRKTEKIQEAKNFNEKNCVIKRVSKMKKKTQSPKEYSIASLLIHRPAVVAGKINHLVFFRDFVHKAQRILKLFIVKIDKRVV